MQYELGLISGALSGGETCIVVPRLGFILVASCWGLVLIVPIDNAKVVTGIH